MTSIKDNRVDVRYYMNTRVKLSFGCAMSYQKLKHTLMMRRIKKEYKYSIRDCYFNRDVLNPGYPPKYYMEC